MYDGMHGMLWWLANISEPTPIMKVWLASNHANGKPLMMIEHLPKYKTWNREFGLLLLLAAMSSLRGEWILLLRIKIYWFYAVLHIIRWCEGVRCISESATLCLNMRPYQIRRKNGPRVFGLKDPGSESYESLTWIHVGWHPPVITGMERTMILIRLPTFRMT